MSGVNGTSSTILATAPITVLTEPGLAITAFASFDITDDLALLPSLMSTFLGLSVVTERFSFQLRSKGLARNPLF
jgi:hypothetical protein